MFVLFGITQFYILKKRLFKVWYSYIVKTVPSVGIILCIQCANRSALTELNELLKLRCNGFGLEINCKIITSNIISKHLSYAIKLQLFFCVVVVLAVNEKRKYVWDFSWMNYRRLKHFFFQNNYHWYFLIINSQHTLWYQIIIKIFTEKSI